MAEEKSGQTSSKGQVSNVVAQKQNLFNGGVILIVFAIIVSAGIYYFVTKIGEKAELYHFGIAAILALAALIAVIKGGNALIDHSINRVVIPDKDRDMLERLIEDEKEKGIDQYIRLSSLSGVTGGATKLGLTGLPLATVGLTIFFSVIALFESHLGVEGFLDLAKLTLGAFIGSFVQRNITGDRSQENRAPVDQV